MMFAVSTTIKRIGHPWLAGAGLHVALFGLGLGLGGSASCTVESVFTCLADEDCVAEGGEGGVCEPNSLCTFPDAACPAGKRWHDRAAELAGKCYDPADLGGTGTGTATGTGSSGSEGSSTSAGSESSTTLPADESSSGEPPSTTDTSVGSSSSGGMPMTCDAQFGGAMGYELCEETDTSCSFNVVLGGTSCNDLCPMFGSTCTTAFNNSAGDCASIGIEAPCDEVANDQICVCAK